MKDIVPPWCSSDGMVAGRRADCARRQLVHLLVAVTWIDDHFLAHGPHTRNLNSHQNGLIHGDKLDESRADDNIDIFSVVLITKFFVNFKIKKKILKKFFN